MKANADLAIASGVPADRVVLAEDGIVVDLQAGKVLSGPEIHARGFAEDESVFDTIKPQIVDALDKLLAEGVDDQHQLQQAVRRTIGRWVGTKVKRRPMIIPVVIEA
jgi:ribonuclease J